MWVWRWPPLGLSWLPCLRQCCACARTQLLFLPTHSWAGTAETCQACSCCLRGWVELGE